MELEDVQARVSLELTKPPEARRRSRRKDIPKEVRKQNALERASKNVAAWTALEALIRKQKDEIARIAKENGVNASVLKQKAFHITAIKPTRKTNKYNAYRRFRKLHIDNFDFGMNDEQRAALKELQALPHSQGYEVWNGLSDDIKELVICFHDSYRMNKAANSRGSRKSVGQNFRRSVERISAELQTMSTRCRTSAICIIVRGSTTVNHDPFIYTDNISKEFFEKFQNINLNTTVEQFEGYAINGVRGLTKVANGEQRRLSNKSQLRQIVRSELRKITGDENVTMSWMHYEQDIVRKYKVKLEGWPNDFSFDIDSMATPDLQTLLEGFNNGRIRWVRLSLEEIKELNLADEPAKKRRKERSDKGIKRGPYKKRRVLSPITNLPTINEPSTDSSDDSSSDSDGYSSNSEGSSGED